MTTYEQKITFGETRSSGVRDVLIYCRDHRCSHYVEVNADGWPDDVRLSDIEPKFTCTKCGKRARISGRTFRRRGWGLLKVVLALLQEAPHRFAGAACWHRYWGRIAVEDHPSAR